MNINIDGIRIQTNDSADFLAALGELIDEYGTDTPADTNQSTPCPDYEKVAESIHDVAMALRKEGLSEGQIRAALLAICGVQVDDSLLRRLTRFQWL